MKKKNASTERHRKINETLGGIMQWQIDHGKGDELAFKELGSRLDTIESHVTSLPSEEKIAEIVKGVMLEVLFSTGRWTKGFIITGAAVVISLGVFTGTFKALLVWVGLSKM